MNYTLETPSENTAVLSFTISKDDFAKDLEAAAAATQSDDADKNRQYAIASAAGQVLAEAVQKDNLKLATEPALVSNENTDGSVSVTLTLTLVPHVELPEYTGLNFVKEPASVQDEEVMQEVMNRVMSTKLWNTLPADALAKNGDEAIIDFVGEKDGVPFPGGAGTDYPLVLGSGSFIPGFEEQVVGMKAGDSKDLEVVFPEDYFEKSLAGQPVIFKVTVKELREPIEAKLDNNFIEQMGIEGVTTVEELQKKVAADMLANREQEAENRLAFDILNRIADGAQMNIPQAMIDSQVDQHIQQYEGQLGQYGMSLADFLKSSGQSLEDFKAKLAPEAEKELRAALVLDAIAQKEQIKADDEELKKEYELLSSVYNFPADQLKMMIPQEAVAGQIAQRKTLDFLKENNTKA